MDLMERRNFLKLVAGYGAASLAGPATVLMGEGTNPSYFGLHPFIEAHPEAVFIRKTNVKSKFDAEQKKQEGLALGKLIFTLQNTPGIPLTHKFAIKPNLTAAGNSGPANSIVTDPYVVEGLIGGLKHVGITAEQIYMREGLMVQQPGVGYIELAQRSGVHYGDSASRTPTLRECPDGVVFKRTKFLGPFNYPDSYLINVSKFKTHSMGLTLCVKNLQGTNIPPYIAFCYPPKKAIAQDFQRDWERNIDDLHGKHLQAGLPRWETEKGAYMERWIQRTLDAYPLIRPTLGLNIIEGVYAQNGNGFGVGPGAAGVPDVFMTNVLIFGKDAFSVDIIGHWLGGNEPGNFGLFHIARERGVSTALNPRNVPVYLWEDSGPKLIPLDKLARTPLATPYLRRTEEPLFHFCNEPFVYPTEKVSACLSGQEIPEMRMLGQTRLGQSHSSLVIEYSLPQEGNVSLELCDAFGQPTAVLAQGRMGRGVHMAAWNTRRVPSGSYYCRLRTPSFDQVKRITLAG